MLALSPDKTITAGLKALRCIHFKLFFLAFVVVNVDVSVVSRIYFYASLPLFGTGFSAAQQVQRKHYSSANHNYPDKAHTYYKEHFFNG